MNATQLQTRTSYSGLEPHLFRHYMLTNGRTIGQVKVFTLVSSLETVQTSLKFAVFLRNYEVLKMGKRNSYDLQWEKDTKFF